MKGRPGSCAIQARELKMSEDDALTRVPNTHLRTEEEFPSPFLNNTRLDRKGWRLSGG